MKTLAERRALLDRYRVTVAPTLDGYAALISGTANAFATVATINGPAIRAEFSWQATARILERGGKFASR